MNGHILTRTAGVIMLFICLNVSPADCQNWGRRGWLYPGDLYKNPVSPEGFRDVKWLQRKDIPWQWERTYPRPCRVRKDEDHRVFGVEARHITYTFRNSCFYGVRIDIEGKTAMETALATCRSQYPPVGPEKIIGDHERSWRTKHTSVWITLPEEENGTGQIYLWGRDRRYPDDSDRPVYLAKPPALNTAPMRYKPRQYVVYRTSGPIVIDGSLDEKAWRDAAWTEAYQDHQAPYAPEPWKTTRSKILYDDDNIYFAAQLQEENVWGHIAVKDTIIYYDNDWEIFLNPTADGNAYYEFEINPLNYAWDMFHETDYHRASCLEMYYDITGLAHAVNVKGTLNWHHDEDTGWTVEVKWPLASLRERNPNVSLPVRRGDTWRVNFSRVQYQHVYDLEFPYMLPQSPCEDWVWQSTNTGDLHNPEMWGKLIFSDLPAGTVRDEALEQAFPILDPPPKPKRRKGGMVRFPACTITLGPDPTDPERSPSHRVEVPEFRMDRYEVTVAEFTEFLNKGDRDEHYDPWMQVPELCGIVRDAPGTYHVVPGRGDYPVVFVRYEAAMAYAAYRGKELPTEAMWERAARGIEGRTYPWGNDSITPERANYDFHYGGTLPVGSLPEGATPEGLYDLCGNVKEWTCDRYESYPGGRAMVYLGQCPPWNREDPTIFPVARGGAWTKQKPCMAAAYRDTHGSLNMGFRCVKTKD